MAWLLVGTGGAIGALARHGLNTLLTAGVATTFPLGIFVINVIGSAAIGIVTGIALSNRMSLSDDLRLFLTAGVLGGFTTFSAFSLDTLMLLRAGRTVEALINCGGQVTLSLIAVWIGFRLASS